MRRDPGHVGPHRDAMALRRALVPNPFLADNFQAGYVAGLHGSFSSTLSAAANAGATSIELAAEPSVNDLLLVGTNPPLRVISVSGSAAPYTADLAVPVQVAASSGAAVTTLHTVDLYLDQAQGLSATSKVVPGVRYLASYSPAQYDYVVVGRFGLSAGAGSDRFVIGRFD